MDIYSRLLAGENMDDIMAEITAEANAAQTRYNEELEALRKANEAAAAKKATQTAKRDGMKELVTRAMNYLAEHYPAFGFTADDLDDEELNLLTNVILMALDLEVMKGTKLTKTTTVKPVQVNTTPETKIDEVFADFFKSLGL